MKNITQDEFNKVVELHVKWRNREDGGVCADLSETDLREVDFTDADLRSANLRYADLVHLKADEYQIYINSKTMQIGCQDHTHEEWFGFDAEDLTDMHGSRDGVERWEFWKPLLKTICDQLRNNHQPRRRKKMLVLSRTRNEKIIIGDNITITIVEIRGDKVRLGIDAPDDVPVHREEVYQAIKEEKRMNAEQEESEEDRKWRE